MYESFYGFHERPFELTANPRYLFLTSKHREALSNLQYGLSSHRGITLLIGDAGTGKTTIVRAAIESVRGPNRCTVYLSNPTLTRSEFLEFLATGFGLSREAAASKTRFLLELHRSLLERHDAGGMSALIIDEAQSLPYELLEEIRLLANIETTTEKLLAVVLAGQPELAARLNESSLRQLKQRAALRCHLAPLDIRETAAYIAKRIRIAGGDSAQVFTREAVETIHERSRGIPRTISVICDNALVNGFALDRKPVGRDVVLEVCRDFDLSAPELEITPVRPEAASAGPQSPPSRADERPPSQGEEAVPAAVRKAASGDYFGFFTRRRRFSFF